MAQLATVYDCPAYKVVENPALAWGEHEGYTPIKHGQKLAWVKPNARYGQLVHAYRVGTVLGYAIDTFRDPDAAREQNRKNGGADHWINGLGVTITAHQQDKETLGEIKPGMKVVLEGKHYEIVTEPNDNLGLKPIE